MKRARAEILSTRKIGAYQSITLVAPEIAERSRPGQFLAIAMPEGREFVLRRHFSIHQASRRGGWAGTLEFVVDPASGAGTGWLAGAIAHEFLDVIGPLGKAFSYPKRLTNCLLVAEGRGAASLFFLAQELVARHKRVDMILGGSTLETVFKPIDAKRLAQTVAVMTVDGSLGARGGAGADPRGGCRILQDEPASRTGRGRGAHGVRIRPLQHVRDPDRTQGSIRLRQPPGMRRRAALRSSAHPMGSVARRDAGRPGHRARGDDAGRRRRSVTAAPSLTVDLGGMILPTPVMIAAGCGGTGRELAGLVDLRRVGAVVSRTITVAERVGSDVPRIAESPAGVVWDTGLQNPGLDAFVAEELIRIARGSARIVVSIGGTSLEEYVRMTSALQGRPEVAAIEIHLSGPDDELDSPTFGAHPDRLKQVVGAVARMSLVPVFAKLPGASDDIVTLARTAIRAGATGVTLLASPPALGLDVTRDRPRIGTVRGWLSGPALKPITLRAVFDVAQALPSVPVIASGGIRTGDDAVECLLAGAWAVQVGTATLTDPAAAVTVAQGIVRRLKAARLASPMELRGRLRPQEPAGADADADPDPVPAP